MNEDAKDKLKTAAIVPAAVLSMVLWVGFQLLLLAATVKVAMWLWAAAFGR